MKTLGYGLRFLLAAVLLSLGSGCATSGAMQCDGCAAESAGHAAHAGGWEVVYANDAEGKRTAGNIETLMAAVKSGKSVRVMIENQGESARYDLPTIMMGQGTVAGETGMQISRMRNDAGSIVYKKEAYYVVNAFSTTGAYSQYVWSLPGTNWQFPGPWVGKSAMTWMVGR